MGALGGLTVHSKAQGYYLLRRAIFANHDNFEDLEYRHQRKADICTSVHLSPSVPLHHLHTTVCPPSIIASSAVKLHRESCSLCTPRDLTCQVRYTACFSRRAARYPLYRYVCTAQFHSTIHDTLRAKLLDQPAFSNTDHPSDFPSTFLLLHQDRFLCSTLPYFLHQAGGWI